MALIQTTISQLRNDAGLNPADEFYTTDEGQEGFWYADGTGLLTEDNTGTVLINTSGGNQRFKRVCDKGFVNVKWFGAKGDNSTDDIIPIQNAIDTISQTQYTEIWNSTTHEQNHGFGGGTVFFQLEFIKYLKIF